MEARRSGRGNREGTGYKKTKTTNNNNNKKLLNRNKQI